MDSYAALEPVKRAYTVAELSSRSGCSVRAIHAGIARFRAWAQVPLGGRAGPAPADGIAAVKVRGRWLIPHGAALHLMDPIRFEREQAAAKAVRQAEARARAEALDAPELVATTRAAIMHLLPSVEVQTEPSGDSWSPDSRFKVGLFENGRMLIATWGWTVGAVLLRLLDAAKIERLRRDVASAGWVVRTERDMPHGFFATDTSGNVWYLDLPKDDDDYFRGPSGVASVGWDYGADAAAIVPEALLNDVMGLSAYLAELRAPGLMSKDQVDDVRARHEAHLAPIPLPK